MSISKKYLLIRADASHRIGVGHVMRCLALAQAWQDVGGEAAFVCHALPALLKDRLTSEGIAIIQSAGTTGSSEDATHFLATARDHHETAIVVDGYHFDQVYHDTISTHDGISLWIDDYGQINRYATSLVLNQNIGANASQYPNRTDSTHLLLGDRFALIRREFTQQADRLARNLDVRNVLVTFGGADPDNYTLLVVNALRTLDDPNFRFRVIAGFLNPNFQTLKSICDQDARFEVLLNSNNMASDYAWADFAISAGGSSNWEMCLFHLPRIIVAIAPNQIPIANYLDQRGCGLAINTPDMSVSNVFELFSNTVSNTELLSRMQAANQRVIDGRGAARCVESILMSTFSN